MNEKPQQRKPGEDDPPLTREEIIERESRINGPDGEIDQIIEMGRESTLVGRGGTLPPQLKPLPKKVIIGDKDKL